MRKIINQITCVSVIIFTLLVLIITLSGTLTSKDGNFPKLSVSSVLDGSVGTELNRFFTENFAFRNLLISEKAVVESQTGESIVNGVFISDDMLLDAHTHDKQDFTEISKKINSFSNSYSGAVYLAVIPSSAGVYSDKLPEYLTYKNTQKQQIDSLYDTLSDNIRKIDAYNILKMMSDSYIYYRSDSKWTSYGAYCVYRSVVQKLGFQPSSYDKYTIQHITDNFKGNLVSMTQYMKSKPDILDVCIFSGGAEVLSCKSSADGLKFSDTDFYNTKALNSENMYDLYPTAKKPFVRINTSVNNQRKLLVIKDSYANCFIPFLIQHYSEIAVFSPEDSEVPLENFVNPDDFEQTLFLFGIESIYK